eukprot:CAMPEP_0171228802 /NCGR_PEP_ID=MMETSP0790-20130122/38555_1 /TAXON_ID=2925 /ORGANISM="Alexandrium catenella, Strain OF101" /LENGTH=230 /DNA_ID=CAMNT_0011694967 /DNA_START=129 /DNA_END=821 /DNA_ORIENTATION=+
MRASWKLHCLVALAGLDLGSAIGTMAKRGLDCKGKVLRNLTADADLAAESESEVQRSTSASRHLLPSREGIIAAMRAADQERSSKRAGERETKEQARREAKEEAEREAAAEVAKRKADAEQALIKRVGRPVKIKIRDQRQGREDAMTVRGTAKLQVLMGAATVRLHLQEAQPIFRRGNQVLRREDTADQAGLEDGDVIDVGPVPIPLTSEPPKKPERWRLILALRNKTAR